ncbi:condensation domain-containing protein [Streptomyces zhihengii]
MVGPALPARPGHRLRRTPRGRAPAWQPLPVQYADYALWQQRLLGDPADPSSRAARQLAFWRTALDGAPEEIELPTDRPRPARPAFTGAELDVRIGEDTHRGLRRLARESGASMFMVTHAVVAALLHRLGAGTDIPLGAPIAGRGDEALDDLVGFFVNTLVLRADLAGDPSFTELLARVRDADLAAFSHADVPFESVVEALNPTRSLARNPLFQVMVGHHTRTGDAAALPGLAVEDVPFRIRSAKFDLVFSFTEHHPGDGGPGSLSCRLEYATELFDRDTAERIGDRLRRLAAALAAEPGRPLSGPGSSHPANATRCSRSSTPPPARSTRPRCPPSSRHARRSSPARSPSSSAPGSSTTRSSTPAPTGSPGCSPIAAWAPRTSWAWPCPGPPT